MHAVPGDFEGRRITVNGEKAAQMFCQVECLTPHTAPFTWLFIRPPWVSSGACCKQCVFTNMTQYAEKVRCVLETFFQTFVVSVKQMSSPGHGPW